MPMRGVGTDPEPAGIVLVMSGTIARSEIPAWCERLRTLLADGDRATDAVICDVGGLVHVDAVTVDALARLQLTALRLGRRLQLRQASAELQGLLGLLGLSAALPLESRVSFQPQRQPEEGEQRLRVQEKRHAADPPAG